MSSRPAPSRPAGAAARPAVATGPAVEWLLRPSAPADAHWMAELRAVVMQPDLERLRRFDPVRVRQRFLDAFDPARTSVILVNGSDVGLIAVRSEDDAHWIEHFYLQSSIQGLGVGSEVLRSMIDAHGDGRPFRLNVLQGSPARRLYERHGFVFEHADPVGVFLVRDPSAPQVLLVGGTEKRLLELHDYDERWPAVFADHAHRIRDALAASDSDVEHIGSTSVPGLAAKPIIDIAVTVNDLTAEGQYLDALGGVGYELRVREPGHRLMRTPERDVHVHIYERGDQAVTEYLVFRDHLRADADDRALYEETKRRLLAKDWDDMNAYADAKTDVISEIKSRAWTLRTEASREGPRR
ncbi:GNAT family N-acetyltransferase [Glaciihabitans tibetensis]|uniref:GNAT family N-acetyltransferase n=1 Tax=Glaciihabitans tibetensis TaxID=1266600 RepID=UPI001FE3C204|nr:GNAT family N-acetyltransferase [Glaciihabitans tibetensis]